MLKTFLYSDRDSSCNLVMSAPTEELAEELLKEKVINPDRWRLEEVEDEED